MEQFDGFTIMPPVNWDAPDIKFPSWLMKQEDVHINELELITVVVAIRIWGERIKNQNVLVYCNNEVTCEVINSDRVHA